MAIVKESLADEVENFASSAWPGEVLLDEKMAWFAALGGGQVNQHSVAGFVAKLANPWSRLRANFKALKTSSKSGNLKGEGLITGGLYVVPRGGPPARYAFLEQEIGDQFDLDAVVSAARRAAGGAQPAAEPNSPGTEAGWDGKRG